MPVLASTAIARAKAATSNLVNGCCNFVWQMYGAPMSIAHADTAAEFSGRATIRYPTFAATPVGAIIYLGALSAPRYAGDRTYAAGDVFIKTDANGGICSDARGPGVPGYMTLAQREAQTGRSFAYGMGDLEGLPIVFDTTTTEEEDPLAGITLEDIHNDIVSILRAKEFQLGQASLGKLIHDRAQLALREEFVPNAEVSNRLSQLIQANSDVTVTISEDSLKSALTSVLGTVKLTVDGGTLDADAVAAKVVAQLKLPTHITGTLS